MTSPNVSDYEYLRLSLCETAANNVLDAIQIQVNAAEFWPSNFRSSLGDRLMALLPEELVREIDAEAQRIAGEGERLTTESEDHLNRLKNEEAYKAAGLADSVFSTRHEIGKAQRDLHVMLNRANLAEYAQIRRAAQTQSVAHSTAAAPAPQRQANWAQHTSLPVTQARGPAR